MVVRPARWLAVWGLLWAVTLAACDQAPTAPDPTPTPAPPPANTAPVIGGITVLADLVEAGESVTVVADVTDAETPLNELTYEWSASAGTMTGSGRSVAWTLLPGSAGTPTEVVFTLTVVEPYEALVGNQIVTREHRVSATSAPIRAHDSVAEISRMTIRFLVELFGDSGVTPDEAVVDFSDTCVAGKAAEYQDIVDNRATAEIRSATAVIESVSIGVPFGSADVRAACTFEDTYLPTNEDRTADGTCRLTSIYEADRWWLCTSNFDPAPTGLSPVPRSHGLGLSGYR